MTWFVRAGRHLRGLRAPCGVCGALCPPGLVAAIRASGAILAAVRVELGAGNLAEVTAGWRRRWTGGGVPKLHSGILAAMREVKRADVQQAKLVAEWSG